MAFRVTRADRDTDPGIADLAALDATAGQIIIADGEDAYSAADPGSASVTATGATAARTLAAHFADRVNVQNYLLAGATDYTAAIVAAATDCYSTGASLWFPAKTSAYVTDCQNFASPINIILDPGATVKLKDSATLDGANLYIFRLRASNSSVVGGTFDFNRDGQDRAAFNTAGGSAVRNYYGVRVLGTLATHIENVKIHTKVINCADFGVALQYCDAYDVDVDVETSGCGLIFVDCDGGVCRRARLSELDNADWEVYPHACDILNCDGGQFDNIEIINQSGYDIASGNSLSDWFTGITIADCDNLSGSNWYVVAKNDTSMTKSVGISMLGVTKSNFNNITVKRYTSVNLEIGALDNCDFANVFLDGEYMTTSLFAAEAQMGCHIVNQGLYSNLTSRVRRPVMNCTFSNMQSVRMLSRGLIIYLGTDCQWVGGKFNGNQYGIDIRSDSVNGSFPTPETQTSARLKFLGVEAKFNEIAGIWNGGSTDLECADCDFSNNGQAANNTGDALRLTGTLAVATSGYYGNNSATTVARTRPRLIGCTFQDDQSVTTSFGSVDPAAPTIVSVERPELYQFGQTVTVNNGATGPVDLIAQVLDINNDELTLSAAMTNFPLVAGTGTMSTSGTTATFSSDQRAIIQGRTWVKNGANYRRIIGINSSNGLTGTLESAFPSDISPAAAFDIVKTEVEQMRSQDYGIYTLSSTLDDGLQVADPKWGAGNKLAQYSVAGSTYWSDTLTFATYAELQEYSPRNGQVVNVLGRTTAGRGGGQFRFTTTSSTTPVTNDPQQGIYLPPASDTSGASGVWIRMLDNLREVTPEMFGAVGDGTTDDYTALQAAENWLEIDQTGKFSGGTLLLVSRYATSDQILIDDFNITIQGDGVERTAAGSSVNGSPCLIGTSTTKPVIRVNASDTKLVGFEVRASAARQAGSTQTGDNTACGIMIATTDTGGAAAMVRIHLEDMLVRDQVDDGIHVCGEIATLTMNRVSVKDNDRHGFHIDDGTLAARSNLGRPGIITMNDCRAVDSGGYGIGCGHPSDSTNAPYRVIISNFEGYRNGLTSGKLYSTYESCHFLRGENIVVFASAFAGTGAGNVAARSCVLVSAADAQFESCRYIEAAGTHFVSIQDIAGFTTRFVRFEGGTATVAGAALSYFATIEAGSLQCRIDNVRGIVNEYVATSDRETLTIASGVVAAIFENHLIDTEAAAATDDIDTINGGIQDQIVRFRSVSSARDPTFKNGTGNIVCGPDRTLSNLADEIAFRYDATAAKWNLISFETIVPMEWRVLAASGVSASHTGDTNETALATVTVPAGAMGANGALRITALWTYTNSANTKTLRCRFGNGLSGTTFISTTATTTAAQRNQILIQNRNATNSQIGGQPSGLLAASSVANGTGTIDTTASQSVTLSALLANSGETITLESYVVELLYQP